MQHALYSSLKSWISRWFGSEMPVLTGGWVPGTSGSAERDYLMPCERMRLLDEK